MNDNELIEKIALLWIECGGDSEGVEWCWRQLRDKIKEIEGYNGNDNQEHPAVSNGKSCAQLEKEYRAHRRAHSGR